MKAAVHVICSPDAAPGIALAGLEPLVADSGQAAAVTLQTLAREPAKGGIVLIEQALYDALPPGMRRQLRRDGTPIVMPFPSPGLPTGVPPEHELLEILRRAIGYRVRLR
ncbi:MAG TPA: V-type ATP synthase subunit F [Kofleriaceae bacterium]